MTNWGWGLSAMPSGAVRVTHYRVDQRHSNAFMAWQEMGSPQHPTPEQYSELEKNGRLQLLVPVSSREVADGKVRFEFDLPRTGVSLLTLEWPGK